MRLRDLFHRAKCLLGGRELLSGKAENAPLPDFVQAFVATIASQQALRNDFLHLADAEPLRRAEILSSWLLARSKHVQKDLSVERLCAFFGHENAFQAVVLALERVGVSEVSRHSHQSEQSNQMPPHEDERDSKKEYPIAS